MAVAFNETSVVAQSADSGVTRQRLLTPQRVENTRVLLDRMTLEAGAAVKFEPSAKSLGWLHVLAGEASLQTLYCKDRMSDCHSAFLLPAVTAKLSTGTGASLLYAEIPDAERLDPGFSTIRPLYTVINWMREPVLRCKNDGRLRVALVSPELCQTAAIRVQMVIYPAGCAAPTYHHEGADSFVYVLDGRGDAWANDRRFSLRSGELVYFPAGERHHLKADDAGDMRFLVFYAPGEFKTVWADPSKASAWVSTGADINGFKPAEDERERRAYSLGAGIVG
jgi:quercetin dioxygenase-like cupin family protein